MKKNYSSSKSIAGRLVACATALTLASSPWAHAQAVDPVDNSDVVELSPFTVSAEDTQGYVATSTLAGTRIKSDLKDLGSAIQVVTAEFLEDTGATDARNLLVYTTNTEVGGAYGNFAGEGAATGNLGTNDNLRSDPGLSSSSRVRGLSSASATRNYFLSGFGFDSYNTEMVTINRGPNSILFGIGEPGGIVDSTLKRAYIGEKITSVSLRYGSEGSYRGTLDINRDLIKDRVALRINALYEDEQYKQEPAYEEDTRIFLTTKAVLFDNAQSEFLGQTILNANWEMAELRGTPPDPIPSQDRYSSWWEAPGSAQADSITANTNWSAEERANYPTQWIRDAYGPETTPAKHAAGQPHIWGAYVLAYDANGSPNLGINNPSGAPIQVLDGTGGPGWKPLYSTESNNGPWGFYPGFQNHVIGPDVWDNENRLLQGSLAHANHDFDAYNISLEQSFMNNKFGFEAAYDNQVVKTDKWFPLSNGRNSSIKIDTGIYLTDGQRNPNLGRPVISGQVEPKRYSEEEWETKRLTAYFTHDFAKNEGWSKWLGSHTVTGLVSEWDKKRTSRDVSLSWNTDADPDQEFRNIVGKQGGWGGRAFFLGYIGPTQWDAATPQDLQLYDNPAQFRIPEVGETFNNYYWDNASSSVKYSTVAVRDILTGAGLTGQSIDSEAVTLQSSFFNDSLIGTFGWRNDDSFASQSDTIKNSLDNSVNEAETLANLRSTEFSGETRSTSLVYHLPKRLTGDHRISLHWAESENFNPAALRRDIYGSDIGPPSGETTEFGFSVGLMEERLSVRLNWYETVQANKTNANIQGNMWGMDWPLEYAQRWLNAKNSWVKGEGVAFEDIGWGDPNDPNEVFDTEATGSYGSYDEVINALLTTVLPQETVQTLFNGTPQIEGPLGDQNLTSKNDSSSLRSVADSVSEGFEIEMVYNITRDWRMAFNASKSEAAFSNGLRQLTPYADSVTAALNANGMWNMYEGGATDSTTMGTRWTNEALTPLAAAAAKEGTLNSELRKWRWNMVTNYTFSEGRLEGLGVGGAVRWQDRVATGYPLLQGQGGILIPDLGSPFFGESEWHGDLWFSYRTKLFERPVKFQLNLQNFFGDDSPTTVVTNPDGQVAVFRNAPQKRWFFTATFDF